MKRMLLFLSVAIVLLALARPAVAQESPYSRNWWPVPTKPTWDNEGAAAYGGLPARVLADPLDRPDEVRRARAWT